MTGHILHFGVGNFCRAHLADYTADAGGWDITGVSLRSPSVRDGLQRQDWAYDLCIMGQSAKRIDVFRDILVAQENTQTVTDAVTDSRTSIISTTVTEKGYHLTSDGTLDLDDPVIASDVINDTPRSLIGFLARGLARRTKPVTVLCSDNMQNNGSKLEQAVKAFAKSAHLNIDFDQISFPNAMVDRITPATTDALRTASGDPMAVPTEPFREWVIEDRFAGPRPDWPGVQIVADVATHERRKLRMLNGAHSYLAYAGTLSGHTYVHEAIGDPTLREGTKRLMSEAAETLPPAIQREAVSYTQALIARFDVPQIEHKLRQIAMDGTQKLPYRIVATIRDRTVRGLPSPGLKAALDAWTAFCSMEIERNSPIDDPKSQAIGEAAHKGQAALMELIGARDLAS